MFQAEAVNSSCKTLEIRNVCREENCFYFKFTQATPTDGLKRDQEKKNGWREWLAHN